MANELGRNKKKREAKKIERLRRLLGKMLCACVGGHKLECSGLCREKHKNSDTGVVECGELYQIEDSVVKQGGSRRPQRGWKYGRQKEGDENRQDKKSRRDKIARDRE